MVSPQCISRQWSIFGHAVKIIMDCLDYFFSIIDVTKTIDVLQFTELHVFVKVILKKKFYL